MTELFFRQGRGGSAAHIQGPETAAGGGNQRRAGADFPLQRFHIRPHQAAVPDFAGREGAIGTAGGAEGNADIDIHERITGGWQLTLNRGDFRQQFCFRQRYVIVPDKPFHRGFRRQAFRQSFQHQMRGADTGEAAPGGMHSGHFAEQII